MEKTGKRFLVDSKLLKPIKKRIPKNIIETKANAAVQYLICINKRKIGNAARESTIKKRGLLAESRQCALDGNEPAIIPTPILKMRP